MKFCKVVVLYLIALQIVCCLPGTTTTTTTILDGNYDEFATLSAAHLDDNLRKYDNLQNRKELFNVWNNNTNLTKYQQKNHNISGEIVYDGCTNSTQKAINLISESPTNVDFYSTKNNSYQILNSSNNFSLNQNQSNNFTTQNNNKNSTEKLKKSGTDPINFCQITGQECTIFLVPLIFFPALFLICLLIRKCLNNCQQQIQQLHHLIPIINLEDLFPINFSADSILQKLPKATKKECEFCEECSICLNKFSDELLLNDDEGIKLPCQHIFHKKCIKKWLNTRGVTTKCPLCAQYITQEPETEPFLNP